MPKKVTKTAPAAPVNKARDALVAQAAERKRVAQNDVYVYVAEPAKAVAPQAQVIVKTIKAAGKRGIKRGDLVEALGKVLTTKQPPERILSYYQKHLVESGAIAIQNPERDAAPKAAKAKKAKPDDSQEPSEPPESGESENAEEASG